MCKITPQVFQQTLTIHAVDCLPNFSVMPEDVIRRFPLGEPIIINAPQSIRADVMAAAQAWETALANQGITIDFVECVCGPLQGARCLIVEETTVPGNPTMCAGFNAPYDEQTGFIDDNAHLYIPDWYDEYQVRRRSILAHELGHGLGLNHTNCDLDDSVMWPPANENVDNCRVMPPGAASTPTPSDGLAAARTPYGTGSRSVCPAQ